VDAHTFTKQTKKVKANIVCQEAHSICFLGQEKSADGGFMQQRTTITSEVHCEALQKLRKSVQNKKGVECSYAV
jgi:hypothetical protein